MVSHSNEKLVSAEGDAKTHRGKDDDLGDDSRKATDAHGGAWWSDDEGATHGEPPEGPSRSVAKESHQGKGPRSYRRPDDLIEDDVIERLADHPEVDATNISVTVKDGVVVLNGRINLELAKTFAVDCAAAVFGVKSVRDLLAVDSPEDEALT